MELLNELNANILAYTERRKSLAQLRGWFSPLALGAIESGDPTARRIALAMIGEFSDFDEGFSDEEHLRNALSSLLPSGSTELIVHQFDQGAIGSTNNNWREIRDLTFAGLPDGRFVSELS